MMDQYQEFIGKSRYARYLPEQSRRENWDESVLRWRTFMEGKFPQIDKGIFDDIQTKIENLEFLPSMRSIMTAGPALKRTDECIFNCAYTTADTPLVFTETMWLLLNGCGVGFSVESRYVDQMPEIKYADPLAQPLLIVVEDSKEGWCRGLKKLVEACYLGIYVDWDLSLIRPKGAPLKTMGGRASGPEPLDSCYQFVVDTFDSARGRKLRPIEVHDMLCKIADSVVVGGVRRSAMISLGDLNDTEHRDAKKGEWWKNHPHRRLANNSAVFRGDESWERFSEEWEALKNSGSGERGIFNRKASQIQAEKTGRSSSILYGTNPCSEIILRPQQFCNLSTIVGRADDTIESLFDKAWHAAVVGTFQSAFVNLNTEFLRPDWIKNCTEEPLLGVSFTGIFDCPLLCEEQTQDGLACLLEELREHVRATNKTFAQLLGINSSPANTCVKPEGTTTQLAGIGGAGIHPAFAEYYYRRVRNDSKDPISQFLKDCGVPCEQDLYDPGTWVFTFPKKAEGAVTRDMVSVIDHLNLWLAYQRHWCDHKPSVTIYVRENEWEQVRDWLWENFNEVTGCAFLPYDGGTYQQAPYEAISEDTYIEALKKLPVLDWNALIEVEDNFTPDLECTAGVCTI